MATIQERIAALKLAEVGRGSPSTEKLQRPALPARNSTTSLNQSSTSGKPNIGNEPGYAPLPPKVSRPVPPVPPRAGQSTAAPPLPTLPPRRGPPSNGSLAAAPPLLPRRGSANSIGSAVSVRSSAGSSNTSTYAGSIPEVQEANRVKAPAYDPTTLPVLPPKRTQEQQQVKRPVLPSRASASSSGVSKSAAVPVAPRKLPPVPSRPPIPQHVERRQTSTEAVPEIQAAQVMPCSRAIPPRPSPRPSSAAHEQAPLRTLPEPQAPKRSALSFGMNKALENAPGIPTRPSSIPPHDPAAAPPDLSSLLASKPKFTPSAAATVQASASAYTPPPPTPSTSCLKCRDFSAPDTHAARFPRTAIPSLDIHWLAKQLTSPFPSATDKARVIFTWLHHNIRYDTVAFFGNAVQPSTPGSTLASGLAVCEGYAGLFAALATAAGLSCVVVGGHGKGYGYTAGSPVPASPSGHAWNAVQIDGGEWKLLDACWGAGHVSASGYEPKFNAGQFCASNAEFGLKHYPADERHFYLPPGVRPPTFAEYWVGADGGAESVTVYSGCEPDHGIDEFSILPRQKGVRRDAGRIRFEMWSMCEHWDNAVHGTGKPYVMVLMYNGETKAFETDGRRRWWCDIDGQELGKQGEAVSVMAVTSLGGQDARGVTVQEWKGKKGRVGMGFEGLAQWVVA